MDTEEPRTIGDTLRIGLVGGAAALVALGTLMIAPAAADSIAMFVRQDNPVALDDDDDNDDDDTGDDTGDDDSSLANSVSNSNDATNSALTAVSRDDDLSQDGLTRDLTDDGKGGPTRDWSDNRTNDASLGDTRASRQTNDNTRSNYSNISRDRDRSRGDLTRDLTRDGGNGQTRDLTADSTNDKSRNDTR
jgi:hypothetical protein